MFDFDSSGVESLELGSRRRPVKWAVELSLADCRPQKHKARRRQQGPGADSAPGDPQPAAEQPQHAQAQQQAQAQRVAAHRKHLEELVLSQEQDPAEVTPAQAKYKKEFRDARVVCLSTEIEQGNVEYKYRLTGCVTNENRRHQLVTQMKFRLSEGSGECFYYLGVEDDGYPRGLEPQELQDSVAVINRMAISLQATARLVEFVPGGFGRTAALLHIKADAEEDMRATDSRVAVAGSMDSGKSTVVAVLTHGADGRPLLDNGRGSARMAVFRHKHEIESGRTSSISQQVLGYDDEGRVLNYVGVATPTPADITAAATHIVNFIDMGGHEKYLKTTLYGMTCLLPDYALLCVDAATGVTRITREHLAVAVALEVPTALVVTKADAVDDQQLQHVLEQLHQLMAPVLHNFGQPEPAAHQQPRQQQEGGSSNGSSNATGRADGRASGGGSSSGMPLVESEAQAVALAAGLSELHSCTAAPAAPSFQQAVFPVFVVSCVSGAGVPLLHAFLAHLKPLQEHKQASSISSTAACTDGAVQAGQVAAGSAVDRSAEAAARPAPSQQQQQQQQQQVAAGVKPSSSQLWVVSPKKHPPASTPMSPVHPSAAAAAAVAGAAAAAAAVAPVPGLPPAPSAPEAQQAAAAAEGIPGPGVGDDESSSRPGHFQVVHTYDVEGVGWVVSGIAVTGTVEVGQSLLWGPTPEGGFSPVRVTCIQRSHVPVRQIAPGQTATLALQPTAPGLPHSGSRQALLTAAAVAQAAAAEAAAREAAAAIAAVPEPTAKTRRRSPAALKAAAAAAAHTAAAAAAAADAARRAASTSGGQAWWVHEPQGYVSSYSSTAAQQESPPLATGGQNGAQQRPGCTAATTSAATAADSVADLLDDDFTAGLAADDGSGSDSEGDLFGAALQQLQQPQQQCRGVPAKGMPVVAAAGTATGSPVGGALGLEQEAEEDMFAGLEGVFDDADGEEQASPGSRSSSNGSSSSSGLANSWSFSSASSSSAAQGAAGACSRPLPAPAAAAGVALSVPSGGARNLSVLSHSSSEQLLGCSPSRWRTKGGVLLDAGAAPHTYWEFEALLVLLGGFWPARGLLSGSWPPAGEDAPAAATAESAVSPAAAGGGGGAGGVHAGDSLCQQVKEDEGLEEVASEQQSQQQRGRKQRRGSKRFEFTYVVHCNSIRQTARVVTMRELRSPSEGDARDGEGGDALQQQQQQQQDLQHHCGLTVSIRAAAALVQGASAVHSDTEGSSGCASGDSSGDGNRSPRQRRLGGTAASPVAAGAAAAGSSGASRRASDAGSVVAVRLRFTHRPEWLQVGARLIVRDRSDGHVAAAGFVTQLLARHTQLQQHHRQTAGPAASGRQQGA